MAKRSYVKKKATNINEKSSKKASQNTEEEAKKKALSIPGPAELAEQIATFSGFKSNLEALSGLDLAIHSDELAKQLGVSDVSKIPLSDFDTLSGRGPVNQLNKLAELTSGKINPNQFKKLVRAEEKLREHVFPNLGSGILADDLAEKLGVSGVSLSDLDTLSGRGPASQLDELKKITATRISLDEFEKLTGVKEELRRNVFSQFCSEDQATEIAKQLGFLGTSSMFSTEEEVKEEKEIARPDLGIGKSVNEVIQWKKSQDPWVEDEEVEELVNNLSDEHPDIDKADEWLESNRNRLTPETLTTIIKTAMARGVTNYALMLGNKRHAENRARSKKIKEIWVSGKYSGRNRCASEEWEYLGFNSEKTARNALNNTPDPSPWPAKEK